MRFLLASSLLAYTVVYLTPALAEEALSDTIFEASKLLRHHVYLSQKVRQRAPVRLNHEAWYHGKIVMETPSAPSTSVSVPSSTPNAASSPTLSVTAIAPIATSTNTTNRACLKALGTPNNQASNPSGIAVCYNVLSFDNSTGVFQADLQLYQISPASDDWAALQEQGMNIKLSYPSTTIAPMYNSSIVERVNELNSWLPIPAVEGPELHRRTDSPRMIADLSLTGSIDASIMQKASSNQTLLKSALTPLIILSGTAKNGTPITTILSSKETSFLIGVFALPLPITTPSKAQVTPFVLPGTSLGTFPTGLVITVTWTLLLVIAVGVGTLQRRECRETYRRRIRTLQEGVKAPYVL
ncbi:MAG: hypothetical protein Q9187_008347 [Circinaria calcarea]